MNRIMLIIFVVFFIISIGSNGDTDDITITGKENVITISAVGDIMMGSDYPTPILPASKGKALFLNVKDSLKKGANIIFGNLEGPLTENGKTFKNITGGKAYAFRTPPVYARNLKDAGFSCVSLANNHIMDFGLKGAKTTMEALDNYGIKHSGLIGDIAQININDVKIGLLSFSTYNTTYNMLDEKKSSEVIHKLSGKFDILIVTMHAGKEGNRALHTRNEFEYFYGEPRGNVIRFAHRAIDNGADLVLGSGPHVVRGFEIYNKRFIAYSLGNFCVYGRFNLSGPSGKSLILKVQLKRDGTFENGKIIPVKIKRPGIPVIDSSGYIIKLIKKLSVEDFGTNSPYIDDAGNISINKKLLPK